MIQETYMQLRKLFIGASLLAAGFSGILEAGKCPFCEKDHPDDVFCLGKWWAFPGQRLHEIGTLQKIWQGIHISNINQLKYT